MRTFKKYDFGIQCTLIIGFLIASLILRNQTFIVGYFVVGGWQVISMLVHQSKHWFSELGTARYHYHRITLVTVLLMLAGLIVPLFLFIFFLLLFAAPFMACYYAAICYDEVYHKMQRPLAQLK